ncbi:MAG: hypothetical protein PHR79_08710, partial [Bacteroidales bacterium]|nr:hypothetical protein [Bacteroidales bacterium]
PLVTSKPKKKDNDIMTMKFLLHKDKENEIPPHIQAHLSLPDTEANASQSQKSLHFAYAPKPNLHP